MFGSYFSQEINHKGFYKGESQNSNYILRPGLGTGWTMGYSRTETTSHSHSPLRGGGGSRVIARANKSRLAMSLCVCIYTGLRHGSKHDTNDPSLAHF